MAVMVDPSGRFAYVANYGNSNISVFAIDQATGILTSGTTVATGSSPRSIAVDPSGRFAYVANLGSSTVSVYTINQTTGMLTAGTAVAAGTNPGSITVDSSGRYVYVANGSSSNVSVFSINQTTGALTPVSTATAGSFPYSIAVTTGVNSPVAPLGVSATVGNRSATLRWTYVAGATSYNIYYSTSPGITIANGTKITGASNGRSITGLTGGVTYYFVVTAVNTTGESVISSEVSAVPLIVADPVNGVCGSAIVDTFSVAPSSNLCNPGSPSAVTASGSYWTWTCGGLNGGTDSPICSAAIQTYPLTLNFNGSGGGSVSDDMSCIKGESCPLVSFIVNTVINLIPNPDGNSLFGGWSDACTNTEGNCSFTMTSPKTVTATFTEADKVRIGKAPYITTTPYTTLISAFGLVLADEQILARAIAFDGPHDITRPVTFKGGFNAGFDANSDEYTILKGKLTIGAGGRLNVEGMKVRAVAP